MRKYGYLGLIVFLLIALSSCVISILPPDAPTDLEAQGISPNEIRLTWKDNSDNEKGFKIERKTDSTDWNEIKTVGANVIEYTDTELTPNTKYYYRVKAYNVIGESGYSNTVEAVTKPTTSALVAPTDLVAQGISTTEIRLTWKDNSDNEDGFKIERKTDSTDWDEIKTVGANITEYIDTELSPNTNYYYRVKAYNVIGESDYSNTASANTFGLRELKWKYTTNDWVYSSPAIGSDGTIYVGSYDGYLYAIKPDSSLKWKYKTEGYVQSSPAIGSDGTIYVGSNDNCLHAINPENGLREWTYSTNGWIESSPAVGSDGTIYVGSYNGYLYAIKSDGFFKWTYKIGEFIHSSPAIGSDGTIYVGSSDGYLYAINSDGSLKWKYKTEGYVQSSPAIGSDGTIYVGSNDHCLHAINPDGSPKWTYETGDCIFSSPAIGSDCTIYVGSNDGYLHAINPDGSFKWKYSTGWIESSPAIGSDGTIYVGSSYGYTIYAINANGSLKWKYETAEGKVNSSPAIGSDGAVYVGAGNSLYAIDCESGGLANTPWPKFRKNNRNTGAD